MALEVFARLEMAAIAKQSITCKVYTYNKSVIQDFILMYTKVSKLRTLRKVLTGRSRVLLCHIFF